MRQLTFEIDCGEETCSAQPGRFCKFLLNTGWKEAKCSLFGEVFDRKGHIQRHSECLKLTNED